MQLNEIQLLDEENAAPKANLVGNASGKTAAGAAGKTAARADGKTAAGVVGDAAAGAVGDAAAGAADCIAWREGKPDDGDRAMRFMVANALHDICRIHGSAHDLLRVTTAKKGLHLFAKRDIPARKLIILPNPQGIQSCAPSKKVNDDVCVKGTLLNTDVVFYLEGPAQGDGGLVETEAGPVRALYLYWVLMGLQMAKAPEGAVALAHSTMNVEVPLATAIVRHPQLKSKRQAKALSLEVPYMTNDCDIAAGARLIVKRIPSGKD